jgi:hypothetical protein
MHDNLLQISKTLIIKYISMIYEEKSSRDQYDAIRSI